MNTTKTAKRDRSPEELLLEAARETGRMRARLLYPQITQADPWLRRMKSLLRDLEAIDRRGVSKLRWNRQSKQREQSRPLCGATTRKGLPCQAKCVPDKARCRMHGGLSTGPKTAAGRQAIIESNQRRKGQRKGSKLAELA